MGCCAKKSQHHGRLREGYPRETEVLVLRSHRLYFGKDRAARPETIWSNQGCLRLALPARADERTERAVSRRDIRERRFACGREDSIHRAGEDESSDVCN